MSEQLGLELALIEAVEIEFKEQYQEFMNSVPDPIYDNVEIEDDEVICKVFQFQPTKTGNASIDENGTKARDEYYRTIPIIKILKSVNEKYPVGTYWRLKDSEAATLTNPYYSEYLKQQKEAPLKGSAKQKEPAKAVNNFSKFFGSYIFSANPVKLFSEVEDFNNMLLPTMKIGPKVKDPAAYVI